MEGQASIDFILGSWPLIRVGRNLQMVNYGLPDILSGAELDIPPLAPGADGYRFLSIPAEKLAGLVERLPRLLVQDNNRYQRHYIDMSVGFDGYMAKFSAKTRSTLQRKSRKLAGESGGTLDVRSYRTPSEIAEFMEIAGGLSARTYQERLLHAGLPRDQASRQQAADLAVENNLRAFLLFMNGRPISYLYLPIRDGVITYAHLGYDADHAALSPGTILQLEALRQLFAEERYRYFDFTEGEGAHKQLFATNHIACATITMLRPSMANWALLRALRLFDATVALGKAIALRLGIAATLRRMLRA